MVDCSWFQMRTFWAGLVLAAIALSGAYAQHTHDDAPLFGKGHAFQIQDLPAGELRDGLESLPAGPRARALKTLMSFSFSPEDCTSLRVGSSGDIAYACAAPLPPVHGKQTDSLNKAPPQAAAAAVAVSSPPVYHSKTGSSNVIYLDFNGHIISGTQWNDTYNFGADYNTYAYSTDGDYTMFSDSEQDDIRRIWERIAEDFYPFDVDVTTEEPALFTPTTARVLITRDEDQGGTPMPAQGSGGFAYINVFGNNDYVTRSSPVLVYYDNHFGATDLMADTSSHEVGHNFGLSHDGTSAQEYYTSHGSGNISWSPLMGLSSQSALTQWSKGEYFNANQTQDDLAIIASDLGYRADDHGNTTGAASALSVNENGVVPSTNSNNGIIEQNSDVDVFSFTCGVGTIALDIDPWVSDITPRGGNLDIAAFLYDAMGTLLVSNNPSAHTYADLSFTGTGGTFYVSIQNSGAGSPHLNPPSGYTEYGSLGQYFISGSVPSVDLSVTAPNGGEQWQAGETETVTWGQGSNASGQVKIELLLNGALLETVVPSTPNTGSYDWTLNGALSPSALYTIRITHLTTTASDTSDTTFGIYDTKESFEISRGIWTEVGGDDFDWDRDDFGTPSSGTGPASGARGSVFYVYVEASYGNNPNKVAFLEASGLDFSGASGLLFGFDYHMYGSAMGTLAVDVFDGTWHSNQWSLTGQQHTSNAAPWSSASVNLDAFAGKTNITIRFRGTTGSGFQGDMAIDCTRFIETPVPVSPGNGPLWWYTQGVILANATPNDFAAVTQGQLKHMATKSYTAMQAALDSGNDIAVNNFPSAASLVMDFTTSNNYLAVNLGQLKYTATPFYNWLINEGLASDYPWTGAPQTNDYAVANIGQLKNIFNFALPSP